MSQNSKEGWTECINQRKYVLIATQARSNKKNKGDATFFKIKSKEKYLLLTHNVIEVWSGQLLATNFDQNGCCFTSSQVQVQISLKHDVLDKYKTWFGNVEQWHFNGQINYQTFIGALDKFCYCCTRDLKKQKKGNSRKLLKRF